MHEGASYVAFFDSTPIKKAIVPKDCGNWPGLFGANSDLEYLEMPTDTTNMESTFYNWAKMKVLKIWAVTPPTTNIFENVSSVEDDLVIYVPKNSVELYKSAQGWSVLADRIQAIK